MVHSSIVEDKHFSETYPVIMTCGHCGICKLYIGKKKVYVTRSEKTDHSTFFQNLVMGITVKSSLRAASLLYILATPRRVAEYHSLTFTYSRALKNAVIEKKR